MHGPLDPRQFYFAAHDTPGAIGRRIEIHDSVASTNALALDRAAEPDAHGLVILAEHQHAGRGRWNRTWHSPRGASVLCTALIVCDADAPQSSSILLWPVLAVRRALFDCCGIAAQIKWPNDLLVRRRKLSGILVDARPIGDRRAYAVGVGINCLQHARHFPPELVDRATSLDLESPEPIDRLPVARALILALDRAYHQAAAGDIDGLKREWREHALPLGERLEVLSEGRRFTGRLVDLDPGEGIVLQLESGGRRLFSPQTTTIQQTGCDS